MRVIQLIDSLHLGGAERMAVNYANALSAHIEGSYLCATRMEGDLKDTIAPEVGYVFLDRKRTFDYKAIQKLAAFIKTEGIQCIHAHGSSYFMATLLKMKMPELKLVWHNHLGSSARLKGIRLQTLKWASRYFDCIIGVNKELVHWAETALKKENVQYLSNFVAFDDPKNVISETVNEGKKVVCLANLKEPKSHLFLLKSFSQVIASIADAELHLVGTDYNDAYSDELKEYIGVHKMDAQVHIHGAIAAPENILNQCAIGVLSSSSEGLPMALLEYGRANLAVITTAVGECPEVIGAFGKTVDYGNTNALAEAIIQYLEDSVLRINESTLFNQHVRQMYSDSTIINQVIALYRKINV
jgi:glycosyltransferase involved in cell wall biosynthesis